MFLFARLVLDSARDLTDAGEVYEELKCLPDSLDEAQVHHFPFTCQSIY